MFNRCADSCLEADEAAGDLSFGRAKALSKPVAVSYGTWIRDGADDRNVICMRTLNRQEFG